MNECCDAVVNAPPRTLPVIFRFVILFRVSSVLCCIGLASGVIAAGEPADPTGDLRWYDAAQLHLEGQVWSDVAARYDRLPARAEKLVRPAVWGLAQNSSGLSVRFITDAQKISARWVLRNKRISMPHMAATGVSGLDLYIRDAGTWRFLAVGKPTAFPVNQSVLIQGLAAGEKEFRLYLPLYNGIDRLEIGLPPGATFHQTEPVPEVRPIVFYGTSITQGGCASRPGMAYPAILGRRLEVPTLNLGFSGNGKCEPEIAALLAEIDAAAFVIDSLPNLETAEAVERLPVFIAKLRSSRPKTPIILVENLKYTNSRYVAARELKEKSSNEFLRQIHRRLHDAGDQQIFLVSADELIGEDGEATVDALHPTDVGFLRMADALAPVIHHALGQAVPAQHQR